MDLNQKCHSFLFRKSFIYFIRRHISDFLKKKIIKVIL